jgi:phosphohistidine phosphatase
MKKLYIIRHAKSSWDSSAKSDFDRPLNKRGQRDAPLMGKVLKNRAIKPDLIISSSAKRAKKTAMIISEKIGYKESEILFDGDLYLASASEILEIVQDVSSDIETLFVIAHNPGMTDFINHFCKERITNLPTTGIFSMEFDILDWKALKSNSAQNCLFDYPKKHL